MLARPRVFFSKKKPTIYYTTYKDRSWYYRDYLDREKKTEGGRD